MGIVLGYGACRPPQRVGAIARNDTRSNKDSPPSRAGRALLTVRDPDSAPANGRFSDFIFSRGQIAGIDA
jgi:hypothetical protein